VQSQNRLTGQWRGTLEENGKEYLFELYLEKDGRLLYGRSYWYESDSSYVEMEVDGLLHRDRSLNVHEVELIFPESDSTAIRRTYQFLYKRSFDDYLLEGWWQEIGKAYNDPERRYGRIYLKRVKVSKA
jgi:hypothetical protein